MFGTGTGTVGRFGLFYLMKHIVDTLDKRSLLYWEAIVAFKNSLYSYHVEDEEKLLSAINLVHSPNPK